jgi:hypothetical protein
MNSKKQSEIGFMAVKALDVEVTRIAQEKRHSHECGVVVYSVDDGITRFAMRVQSGEIRIQPRLEFLPILQLANLKRGRLIYDPGS